MVCQFSLQMSEYENKSSFISSWDFALNVNIYYIYLLHFQIGFCFMVAAQHRYVHALANGKFTSIHSKSTKTKSQRKKMYIHKLQQRVLLFRYNLDVMLIRFQNDWTWTSTLIVLLTWCYTHKKIILFLDVWMLFHENQKSSLKSARF